MIRSFSAIAVTSLLLAGPLHAQSARPGSFGITPYAGYMKFGSLVSGPLGTSVRRASGPVYGAEASFAITPGLALVGNVGYANSDLEVGVPIVGGLSLGRSSALMYDAALRLRVPMGSRGISPFVQAGAGAMRQEIEVGAVATKSTNVAYNVGAGVDVPLGPRLGLQLMAKDYIGKFDAQEATAVNVDTRTTHDWSLSAGLRLGL